MKRIILFILFFFLSIKFVNGQSEEIYDLASSNFHDFIIQFKQYDSDEALMLCIIGADQWNDPIYTDLVLVDYTSGFVLRRNHLLIEGYENIYAYDFIIRDDDVIFYSTARNVGNGLHYFMTISADRDLLSFKIIDTMPIEYGMITNITPRVTFNPVANTYFTALLVRGPSRISTNTDIFEISEDGQILQSDKIEFVSSTVYHKYCESLDSYILTIGGRIFFIESNIQNRNFYRIRYKLNDTIFYPGGVHILPEKNENLKLLYIALERQPFYLLKPNFKDEDNREFDFIAIRQQFRLDDHMFPRSLLKSDSYYLAASTSVLNQDPLVSSIMHIWKHDLDDEVVNYYQVSREYHKDALYGFSVDDNGNLLGYGYSLTTRLPLYFILPKDNNFLVSSQEEIPANTEWSIYPNPGGQLINITLEYDLSEAWFKIFDLNGNVVKTEKLHNRNNLIDTSNLPSGVFLLQIFDLKGRKIGESKKWVKID